MEKHSLIKGAEQLKALSEKAAIEFEQQSGTMISELNKIMHKRPDLVKLIGKDNLDMMQDNHQNQFRFMLSIMQLYKADIFVDTLIWVFHTYRSHGFSEAYWPAMLNALISIMKEKLSKETFDETYPFYRYILINQPTINHFAFHNPKGA